jgi:hypothetical protein
VERVTNSSPQAHLTVISLYSGWIPAFIIGTSYLEIFTVRVIITHSSPYCKGFLKIYFFFSDYFENPVKNLAFFANICYNMSSKYTFWRCYHGFS